MPYILDASCGCNTGRVRRNNEDNFFFDGRCLEADNNGLKPVAIMKKTLRREVCVAIFDGMGGENFGAGYSGLKIKRREKKYGRHG